MAKPDLDDGWFKVAYELLPPLMMCCQRVEASIVLCEVLAQTYGRGKRETAKLEPVKIAARTGRKREYIWKGIRELTANGVIEKMGDGTYRFEKDYEKWGTDEKRLVEAPLARYFAAFPYIAKVYDPDSDRLPSGPCRGPERGPSQGPISDEPHESPEDVSGPSQGPLSGYQQGPQCGPSQGPEIAPPPIRELENGRVVVVGEETGEISTPPTERGKKGRKPAPLASERPYRPDPADLLRAKELIEAIDPHQYLGQKVEAVKTLYPLEWIVEAYVRAAGKADRIVYFANNTLLRWWDQGHMDELPPSRPPVTDPFIPANRPARPSPPSRVARTMAAFDDPRPRTEERK